MHSQSHHGKIEDTMPKLNVFGTLFPCRHVAFHSQGHSPHFFWSAVHLSVHITCSVVRSVKMPRKQVISLSVLCVTQILLLISIWNISFNVFSVCIHGCDDCIIKDLPHATGYHLVQCAYSDQNDVHGLMLIATLGCHPHAHMHLTLVFCRKT